MRQRYSPSPGCHQLQAEDVAWLYNPQWEKRLAPNLQLSFLVTDIQFASRNMYNIYNFKTHS